MRKISLILPLLFITTTMFAQDTIDHDLRNLAKLKRWSEAYGVYPNRQQFNSNGKTTTRDSLYDAYASLISKVKKSPKVYLSHINKALKENTDSLRQKSVFYSNPTRTILYNYDSQSIKIIDLYRVVKCSLLERNDHFLPEDFRSLGVIDPKNYYGYYEPEPKRKPAIRYITNRFSLNSEEKRFLKNQLNVGFVMDIKKFLDTCAQTAENEEFIKTSIAAFVKSKETPLAGLYFYFKLTKETKHYVPKDKQPQQK